MGKPVIITEKEFNETRLKLINAASAGEAVYYETIALEKDNLHHGHLVKVIEAISLFEKKQGRPLLCAIVASNISNKNLEIKKPGDSFDEFCIEYDIQEDLVTLQKECFDKWGDENFRKKNELDSPIIENDIKFKAFVKSLNLTF